MEVFRPGEFVPVVCYCVKCRELVKRTVGRVEAVELEVKDKREYLESETNRLKMEWKQLKRDERKLVGFQIIESQVKGNLYRFDESHGANVAVDPIAECPCRGVANPFNIEEGDEFEEESSDDDDDHVPEKKVVVNVIDQKPLN